MNKLTNHLSLLQNLFSTLLYDFARNRELTLAPGKPANPGFPSGPGDPDSPWIEKRQGSGNTLMTLRNESNSFDFEVFIVFICSDYSGV